MRLVLRTLTRNVHLLLISFVVAMLSLGALSGTTPVSTPAFETQKAHSAPSHSTGPAEATPDPNSISAISAPENPSQSPYESQKQNRPSISTSAAVPIATPTPVAPPGTLACTPCTTVIGCVHACPTPITPAPPEPISPLPPGSCGPCGTYTGPRPQHIVCPMYCAVLTE